MNSTVARELDVRREISRESQNSRLAITIGDVMEMLGTSRSAANRLICTLEAAGLRRKGAGRGTRYDRKQFLELWAKLDTRP